jgi:hypothetical protein
MSTHVPGASVAAAEGDWAMLYTVDQRMVCYQGDQVVDLRVVPSDVRLRLAERLETLLALDTEQRKVAWRQRWLCLFGTKQALYHNVDLSPEAGYEVVIQDGEQTLKPRTDMDGDERRQTENLDEAQVVSSEALDAHLGPDMHRPILDIDFPVHVYPSTTEGHNHLYFDRLITWEKYEALLQALADAEILEPGYVSASLARKHTAVRLPWVKKEAKPDA